MGGLTENQTIRGHANGSLLYSTVGPKRIIQLKGPIFPIRPNHFLKNVLDYPIGHFTLPTSLGMVSSGHFIGDGVLKNERLKRLIAKMFSPITYDCLRYAKMTKDVVL